MKIHEKKVDAGKRGGFEKSNKSSVTGSKIHTPKRLSKEKKEIKLEDIN